jgi:hypothetical protein
MFIITAAILAILEFFKLTLNDIRENSYKYSRIFIGKQEKMIGLVPKYNAYVIFKAAI